MLCLWLKYTTEMKAEEEVMKTRRKPADTAEEASMRPGVKYIIESWKCQRKPKKYESWQSYGL